MSVLMKNNPTQFCSYWMSPLGNMRLDCVRIPSDLIGEQCAVSGIYFAGQKYHPDASTANQASGEEKQFLEMLAHMLESYFSGTVEKFDLVLAPSGTEFQRSVWNALLDVPHGQTISYAELSNRIGNRAAIRAAAAAVGKNPISVVIPCHRIIGTNGSLTGYAGGLDRKAHLLALESKNAGNVQQSLLV
jgi:methylated-DNA-[protein]-cysteine S-methyltransferase